MTFYNNLKRAIMYISPDGEAYKIGIYQEEYPNKESHMVTGQISKISKSRKNEYIQRADEMRSVGKMNKKDVPFEVIESFRDYLPEEKSP